MASYRPGKEIIRAMLEKATVGQIADRLGVDPAHIYNVERRGVSPTLYEALIDGGWLAPPERVYTLAFRFKDEHEFKRARAAVDAGGDRSAWLMRVIDEEMSDV